MSIISNHILLQVRQLLRGQEHLDGPGLTRYPVNEASLFKREDHLMNRRWSHSEVALNISFCWWATINFGVIVNES